MTFMQDWHRATVMYDDHYCDMPYMIRLPSGNIFSTLTVSGTSEGQPDTTIIGLKSTDDGYTWSEAGPICPAQNAILAWAVPWLSGNRLYVAMLFNSPRTTEIPYSDGSGLYKRADIHGRVRIGWSEDEGETWTPAGWFTWPATNIDMRNPFGGVQKLFWLCGMPVVSDCEVFIPFSKMGQIIPGNQFGDTESFILRCPKAPEGMGTGNVLPTIPVSGDGIRAQPLGTLLTEAGIRPQEEPSIVMLPNGRFYGVFRTTLGRVGEFSVNRDGSELEIEWARQADGDTLYNPRSKAELFDLGQARYVLWHHAMSGAGFDKIARSRADVRIGAPSDNRLVWSKPIGIAFNARAQNQSMSYPSAILSADGSELIFSATDKASARCWRMPLATGAEWAATGRLFQ